MESYNRLTSERRDIGGLQETAEKPDRQTSFTHTTDVYTDPEKRYEWNNKNNLH